MRHLTPQNLNLCPSEKGIYRIFAVNRDDNPIQIFRFGGVDNTGLLYIGQTSDQTLLIRLSNFLRVSSPGYKTTNHSGALKYKRSERIREILGEGHKLFFQFEICENPKTRENELLKNYASQYGEYPPLNG